MDVSSVAFHLSGVDCNFSESKLTQGCCLQGSELAAMIFAALDYFETGIDKDRRFQKGVMQQLQLLTVYETD